VTAAQAEICTCHPGFFAKHETYIFLLEFDSCDDPVAKRKAIILTGLYYIESKGKERKRLSSFSAQHTGHSEGRDMRHPPRN
jgi:hypothetical protein